MLNIKKESFFFLRKLTIRMRFFLKYLLNDGTNSVISQSVILFLSSMSHGWIMSYRHKPSASHTQPKFSDIFLSHWDKTLLVAIIMSTICYAVLNEFTILKI